MDMAGMTEYQKWEHAQIEDISHDTDALIKMLGSEKVGESYDSGLLAGMLSKQGIDPGVLALLDRGKDEGWDSGMLIVLFLILILGFGNGGFGFGRGAGAGMGAMPNVATESTVINEANYTRLLDAIGTQGTRQEVAVSNLAQALGCDMNSVKGALAGLDKQLAVNQGSIVNAIQSCCCNMQAKMQECCCQTNLNIERTGNSLQTSLLAQSNAIQQQFYNQNAYLAEQFCQIKNREDQREIQSLRDKLAEQRDTANTLAILNAIANKDNISYSGTIDGTTVTGTGTLS